MTAAPRPIFRDNFAGHTLDFILDDVPGFVLSPFIEGPARGFITNEVFSPRERKELRQEVFFAVASAPLGNASTNAKIISSGFRPGLIAKNKAAGDAFEQQVMQQLQNTQSGVVPQVTVRTQSGVRTRIDLLGRDSSGRIICTECKSSATAPLTTNQAAAFPEIQRTGGVVVGRGKPGFPGGTEIPPTTVDIVRP